MNSFAREPLLEHNATKNVYVSRHAQVRFKLYFLFSILILFYLVDKLLFNFFFWDYIIF